MDNISNASSPIPPLPSLLLLQPLDVHLGPAQHVRHLGLHRQRSRGGAEGVAGDGAESGGRELRTRGKSGRLPSQRLVHGLALEKLGSDGGGREGEKKTTQSSIISAWFREGEKKLL